MLQWTRIQLPLSGPLDQATDPKIVDPTKAVASLVNATYNHDGAISKAHGVTPISYTTPQDDPGVRIGNALVKSLVTDGQRFYIGALHSVDPVVGSDYYAPDFFQAMCLGSNSVVAGVGPWSPVAISQHETVRLAYLGAGYRNVCSVVSAGGFLWTAWNDGGTAYYQVSDEVSGVVVQPKTALWKPGAADVGDLRVVALTDYVFIFYDYSPGGSDHIIAAALQTADPTAVAVTSDAVNAKNPAIGWDACYFSDGTNESAILTWYWDAFLGDRLYLMQFTNSPVPDATDFDAAITAWDGPLACCYHHDTANADHLIAVAYQHDNGGVDGGIRVRTYDDGLGLDAASGDLVAVGTIGGTVTRLAISTEIAGAGAVVGYSEMTVWFEVLRDDSTVAVKAEYTFATTHIDTVIEAHTAGAEGNGIEVALIGDDPAGVTIERIGRVMVIHFFAGTSTRANVVAAINALAGADDIIDVRTAGVAAGALTVAVDQIGDTQLHEGADATTLQTYRVRPVKLYRTIGPPTLHVYGIGSAWENCCISSRAVYFKQRSHCWLHYDSDEWPLMVLATTGDYLASAWERRTEAIANQGRSMPRGFYSVASAWDDVESIWAGTTVTNDDETKSILALKADFSLTGLKSASVGGSILVGGGQVYALDGRCMPSNFAHHPEVLRHFQKVGPTASGGLKEGSVYKYLLEYEWTDHRGLIHRSAPSLPYEVTLGQPGELTSMDLVVDATNCDIDWTQAVGLDGTTPWGWSSVVTTAIPAGPGMGGAYQTHQLLADAANAALQAAGANFRILAGAARQFTPLGEAVALNFVPTQTDRYEFVNLSPGRTAERILFLRGPSGPAGTGTSAASLLGFDDDRDYEVAFNLLPPDRADYGYVNPRNWPGDLPFVIEELKERAEMRLDFRNLIIGDEVRNTGEVRIALFRTLADGEEYYLVDTFANNTAAAWQTYTDTATDLSISEHRQPYTTGEPNDVLENAHPVGHILWSHGDRIWIVDNEDSRRVWVSKPVAVGIAPEFPYELQIVMPDPITAGLSIATHALLFSKQRCWAITGDGPNALGVGDWLAPRLLSSDNGAVDYRGVCEIEGGAIVWGLRGLYAIQGGSVQPIGREVQDLLEGAEVKAIINRRDDREVWVFIQPPGFVDGVVVVYDYERKRWGKLTWGTSDAAIEQDGLIYCGVNSTLRIETPAVWTYGGIAYTHQVETGWLKLGGLAGYQRVRRAHLIGTWIGSCTVSVEVFYDYEATAAQTVSLPMLTKPAPDALARFVPLRQKCAAVKFRVTVTATPAAPEKRGIDLHAIELEIGTKGAFRRAAVSK